MHHGISNPAFHTYRPTIATGGTSSSQVFDGRMYKVHFFDTVGSNTFTVHSIGKDRSVDYIAVGGGGRGGNSYNANIDGGCGSYNFYICCDMWGCYTCGGDTCTSYNIGATKTYFGGGGAGGEFISGSYNVSTGDYDASVGAGATATNSSYTMPTHNSAQAPGTVTAISNTISSELSGKSSIFGYYANGGSNGQDGVFGASGAGASGTYSGGGGVAGSLVGGGTSDVMPSGGGSGATSAGTNANTVIGGSGGNGATGWFGGPLGSGGDGGTFNALYSDGSGAAGTSGTTAFAGVNTRGGGGSAGKVQAIGTSKLYSIITAGGNGGSGTVAVRYPIEKPLPRINLVENPNFESGTTYWSANNGSISQITSESRSGLSSMKYSPTANGSVSGGGSASGNMIPVEVGKMYSIAASVKGNTGSCYVGVDRYGPTGTYIGGSFGSPITSNGNWREGVIQITIPSGTSFIKINIANSGYSSGQELFIDNILCEQTDVYPSGRFFDGNTPGGIWTGTQNLSQSKI